MRSCERCPAVAVCPSACAEGRILEVVRGYDGRGWVNCPRRHRVVSLEACESCDHIASEWGGLGQSDEKAFAVECLWRANVQRSEDMPGKPLRGRAEGPGLRAKREGHPQVARQGLDGPEA